MSNRYGRNQRRKAREELTSAKAAHAYAVDRYTNSEQIMARREARMVAEHAEEIKAARMARDTIRITVDDLLDPRDQRIQMRGRFELMASGREPIHAAVNMDPCGYMMARSDRERSAFVTGVGQSMAEYALAAIMRHWRSR